YLVNNPVARPALPERRGLDEQIAPVGRRLAPIRNDRDAQPIELPRGFVDPIGKLLTLRRPRRDVLQLYSSDRSLDLGHSPVGAETLMQPAKGRLRLDRAGGGIALAVILDRPGAMPELAVVRGDHAAFAGGSDDLVLTERPSRNIADRSNA